MEIMNTTLETEMKRSMKFEVSLQMFHTFMLQICRLCVSG